MWSLQEELIGLLRRWYLLTTVFLAGGLAGWLLSLALPPQFEAEARLSVSFNADAVYLTPDDYKNWQVAELEDFVVTNQVFEAALEKPGLQGWSLAELRAAAEPRWRNAGVWQLVVTASDPEQAAAAAAGWRTAVLEQTADALTHAVAFNRLDRLLDEQARALGEVRRGLGGLAALQAALESWLMAAADGPGAGFDRLAARVANHADPPLAAAAAVPGPDAGLAEQTAWAHAALAAVEAEIAGLRAVEAVLLQDYDSTETAWLEEHRLSRGLSAYLAVDPHEQDEIEVTRVYASGLLGLVGGIVGALGYTGWRLWRAALRSESDSAAV